MFGINSTYNILSLMLITKMLSVMYSMHIFPHFKSPRPILNQTVNPTTFTTPCRYYKK